MDFGRISIDHDLILYLFGTPGQTRFWFMWDELVRGAIGAVVMVDTRRLADCFAAIDFFEHRRLPYLVAINCFDGVQYHDANDVREALAISAGRAGAQLRRADPRLDEERAHRAGRARAVAAPPPRHLARLTPPTQAPTHQAPARDLAPRTSHPIPGLVALEVTSRARKPGLSALEVTSRAAGLGVPAT